VLAQGLALLAGDLVGVGDEVVEPVVLVEPLGGVALTHARDPGQVVGGLPHQRGELGVARGRNAVALLHCFGCHPLHLGHPAHGVDDGGVGVDELEGVAVARADQDLEPGSLCLGREGADDVVGLVALLLEEGDPHGIQHLLDQRELAGELAGRLAAAGLVFGVLLQPEGLARDVERHGDVRGPLVAEHVDQHRGEPEDRVGGLSCRGREVLQRQREEGAVGQ
jgi:hypothetical protein